MAAPASPSSHVGRHRVPAHVPARQATGPSSYRPRRPVATPLYPVVQHHLETFLATAQETDPQGYGVPGWVEHDFRAYLRCGILAHGFARARCPDCGHERLVAFSCKGRGVCPSCNARRMAEVAAHMTDHVLPHLPVRQWVLSLPKRLRPFLHHKPEVASAVLAVFLRALRAKLRRASPGATAHAQIGAVSFPQRFGSSLNTHFHFHVLALDGVFSEDPASGHVRFHEASALAPAHWQEVERTVQRRVLKAFCTRGLLEPDAAHAMLSWQASGGFSVDASVRVEGDDRTGVERLVRYCARPPLALERLHALGGTAALASPDARLLYRLPGPDLHGRTEVLLSPLELLERLARLITPPRLHRHRYHGVLAPHARLRPAVTLIGRAEPESSADASHVGAPASSPPLDPEPAPAPSATSPARVRWAQLLARIYEVLPLLCPACGGELRILAFLTDAPTTQAILLHLELPHRPPPLAPARAPPQSELLLDQSPDFDLTAPEPVPDFDFDQSLRDSFD